MSKKIFTAQSVEELQFLLNKIDKLAICLPLNLSTQIYCIKHKIQFYNPIDFIDNNTGGPLQSAIIEEVVLIGNGNNINNNTAGIMDYYEDYK